MELSGINWKRVNEGIIDRDMGSIRDPPKSVKLHELVIAESLLSPWTLRAKEGSRASGNQRKGCTRRLCDSCYGATQMSAASTQAKMASREEAKKQQCSSSLPAFWFLASCYLLAKPNLKPEGEKRLLLTCFMRFAFWNTQQERKRQRVHLERLTM